MDLYDDENAERAALYRLFRSVFAGEPSEEELVTVKEMFQMKFDETADEIGNDFRSLFREPLLRLLPYESFYNYPLGDRPGLWGKAAYAVQEFYRSAGVMIDEEANLAPDHLSVELLFMN